MLREQSALIVKIHKWLDIALTAVAFISAYFIKLYLLPKSLIGLTTDPNYYVVLLQMIKAVATGMVFIVPLGDWEKNPRLQAKTLV